MKNELIEIRKRLGKLLFNFAEVTTDEGLVLVYDGELAEGLEIFVYNEEGEKMPAPNGDYKMEGITITITDGKITKIEKPEETVEEPVEEVEQKLDFSRVEALESRVAELTGILDKVMNVVTKFAKEPVTEKASDIEVKGIQTNPKNKATKFFN